MHHLQPLIGDATQCLHSCMPFSSQDAACHRTMVNRTHAKVLAASIPGFSPAQIPDLWFKKVNLTGTGVKSDLKGAKPCSINTDSRVPGKKWERTACPISQGIMTMVTEHRKTTISIPGVPTINVHVKNRLFRLPLHYQFSPCHLYRSHKIASRCVLRQPLVSLTFLQSSVTSGRPSTGRSVVALPDSGRFPQPVSGQTRQASQPD